MMEMSIAIVIYICLSLHSYLNYYFMKGALPHVLRFMLFGRIEMLLILINCLHLLGWLWGVLVFAGISLGGGVIVLPLCCFLHGIGTQNGVQKMFLGEQPNSLLYRTWFLLVLSLVVLSLVNPLVTPYKSGLVLIISAVGGLSKAALLVGGMTFAIVVYLFVGLVCMARDYAVPPIDRPVYTHEGEVWAHILQLLLWPIPRIGRKLMERRFRC